MGVLFYFTGDDLEPGEETVGSGSGNVTVTVDSEGGNRVRTTGPRSSPVVEPRDQDFVFTGDEPIGVVSDSLSDGGSGSRQTSARRV